MIKIRKCYVKKIVAVYSKSGKRKIKYLSIVPRSGKQVSIGLFNTYHKAAERLIAWKGGMI